MIRARFDGQTYLYQPFIFTDNEIPLVAGREIWGYAKKLAVMERSSGGAGTPFGEQMLFTVERPRGQRIMTMAIVVRRARRPGRARGRAGARRRGSSPTPRPASRRRSPSWCGSTSPRRCTRAPTARRSCGPAAASVTMDARSPVDPWHLLAPTRIWRAGSASTTSTSTTAGDPRLPRGRRAVGGRRGARGRGRRNGRSAHRLAAVEDEAPARREARLVGEQERNHGRRPRRGGEAAERQAREERLVGPAPPIPSSSEVIILPSTGPGQTALTRIPRSAHSSAAVRVMPITACFEAM